jgi:hypothetical protein
MVRHITPMCRDLPFASGSAAAAGDGTRGVKSSAARRPLPPDAIFLETVVSVYFFSVLQFWRIAIWLASEV